jgi:large subunit ribosomal protein L37Ae
MLHIKNQKTKKMPTKRFGARYGRRTKTKFAQIESQQRSKHKCPYCFKVAVKRLAAGIWQCNKCDKKFAGKAYTV